MKLLYQSQAQSNVVQKQVEAEACGIFEAGTTKMLLSGGWHRISALLSSFPWAQLMPKVSSKLGFETIAGTFVQSAVGSSGGYSTG